MTIALAPAETDILTALRAFLLSVLPASVAVIKGQVNRVPEPAGSDYVVMTPIMQGRLSTNVDDYVDDAFVGSIAADVLTITQVLAGALEIGSQITGAGVTDGTNVTQQLTGSPGGIGTYRVDKSQTVSATIIAAGRIDMLQPTKVTVQLDVHGPNANDNAQRISTAFRDDYAIQQFASSNANVVPLYSDDPKQMPFINDQQQYEDRWVIGAVMQANQTLSGIPQQFADQLAAGLIDVDAVYPAAP